MVRSHIRYITICFERLFLASFIVNVKKNMGTHQEN
jgi:hypothetical protein